MKSIILWLTIFTLFIPGMTQASYTEYCKGTEATNEEDAVIQRLVPKFGIAMGCEIGENCLKKWDIKGNREKFSINWKKACGPVMKGIPQFENKGKSSTFICHLSKNNSVCCAPLGYEHIKKFNLCSDTIIKKPS